MLNVVSFCMKKNNMYTGECDVNSIRYLGMSIMTCLTSDLCFVWFKSQVLGRLEVNTVSDLSEQNFSFME